MGTGGVCHHCSASEVKPYGRMLALEVRLAMLIGVMEIVVPQLKVSIQPDRLGSYGIGLQGL